LRAFFVHETWILVTFTICSPARTVTVYILAGGFASLAGDRAVADHEVRVFVALSSSPPTLAIFTEVTTNRGTKTAACRADPKHCIWVSLAFAVTGPLTTGYISIIADVRACPTGERTNLCHRFRIVSGAFPISSPVSAVNHFIVAEPSIGNRHKYRTGDKHKFTLQRLTR